MITENGRVVAIDGERAWVQTIRNSACQSCAARHGCGQRALAGVTGGRANQVLVANELDARVGDEVTLAIDEAALLRASLLVYAVPLLLMVTGAVLGHGAGGQDLVAIAGALTGLAGGFMLIRWLQRRSAHRYEPRLIRIVPGMGGDVSANPTVS
ncbi:sigma E positive regulator RseC/MucC [Marinobacter sp. NP-4(2019)]|uniref:SoxR reducing system RseC family protein n=1 Tax=Marinobacter sp. NP-4(2019) TaxID=2488665 RepID=UPI000FC3E005|nr:SoxR reducing system RseC family protein [Marinobacter sp. NP-4(2019)]AZT83078.1 sigma E positive regulator RseC/MucC [Marinobacter sp. NP-4(2019)]